MRRPAGYSCFWSPHPSRASSNAPSKILLDPNFLRSIFQPHWTRRPHGLYFFPHYSRRFALELLLDLLLSHSRLPLHLLFHYNKVPLNTTKSHWTLCSLVLTPLLLFHDNQPSPTTGPSTLAPLQPSPPRPSPFVSLHLPPQVSSHHSSP